MKLTLCGSARFMPSFVEWNRILSNHGHVVYSLGANARLEKQNSNEKLILDLVHFKKIIESEGIVVLNDQDYIGESTKKEIIFALLNGKRVFVTTKPAIRDWGLGDVVAFPASCLLGMDNVEAWKLCESRTADKSPPEEDKVYPELQEEQEGFTVVLTNEEFRLLQGFRKATKDKSHMDLNLQV